MMRHTAKWYTRLFVRTVQGCPTPSIAQPNAATTQTSSNDSLQTFTCARRWQQSSWACASSSVLSRRHLTQAAPPCTTGASPPFDFEDFVAQVQRLLQEEETMEAVAMEEKETDKASLTSSQQARMAALWKTTYHQHIFASLEDAGADTREWDRYIPQEAETLPLFLVCLCAATNVLQSKAVTSATNDTTSSAQSQEQELQQRYVEEVRALVLFVVYNYVPNISSLFDWTGVTAVTTPPPPPLSPPPTSPAAAVLSTAVVPTDTADKAYREAITELRVERHGREKVHELAPRLSADVLLRMTVLLDMVHSVVTTFALPLKGYAILYQALLCGLGTSAQLSNATLMVLLDCMQRCLDGYLADLELSAEDANESLAEAATTEEDKPVGVGLLDSYDDIRVFLPRCYLSTTTTMTVESGDIAADELSLVEVREQAQLQRRRGGLQRATVIPTVVLDHLHIIARVLCQRMETQILDYQRRHWREDGTFASKRWQDDPAREAKALRQLQSEKGKLHLLRLEERKKVEQPPQTHQRRTLRSFQAGPTSTTTKETTSEEGEEEGDELIQPAQLALCCTYLAAMRFHDDTYWTTVRRLSCLLLHCHREAADGTAVTLTTTTTTATATAANQQEGEQDEGDRDEEALLMAMKDITFAFDYVNRPNDYQRIMSTLVQEKYLQRPIAPPSQYRQAMSSVPRGDNKG